MSCKENLNNFISIVEFPCHTNVAFKGTLFFFFENIPWISAKLEIFFPILGEGWIPRILGFRDFFSLMRSSKITQSKYANSRFRTFVGRNFTINLQVARLATSFVHERKPTFSSLGEKLKKKNTHLNVRWGKWKSGLSTCNFRQIFSLTRKNFIHNHSNHFKLQ